jgi:hypothetical protein
MTRVPHPRRNGVYIDRGHTGRKVVFWAVALTAGYPLGLLQVAAVKLNDLLEAVSGPFWRLREWSHPCLYKRLPRRPAPELAPDWKARNDHA